MKVYLRGASDRTDRDFDRLVRLENLIEIEMDEDTLIERHYDNEHDPYLALLDAEERVGMHDDMEGDA